MTGRDEVVAIIERVDRTLGNEIAALRSKVNGIEREVAEHGVAIRDLQRKDAVTPKRDAYRLAPDEAPQVDMSPQRAEMQVQEALGGIGGRRIDISINGSTGEVYVAPDWFEGAGPNSIHMRLHASGRSLRDCVRAIEKWAKGRAK